MTTDITDNPEIPDAHHTAARFLAAVINRDLPTMWALWTPARRRRAIAEHVIAHAPPHLAAHDLTDMIDGIISCGDAACTDLPTTRRRDLAEATWRREFADDPNLTLHEFNLAWPDWEAAAVAATLGVWSSTEIIAPGVERLTYSATNTDRRRVTADDRNAQPHLIVQAEHNGTSWAIDRIDAHPARDM